MDPDAMHGVLAENVLTQANWILRSGAVCMILEQLVMCELFGGCTLNIYEWKVYRGLEEATRHRQRDNLISPATLVRPPKGYPRSPSPFPLEVLTVTDEAMRKLKEVQGPKEATPLTRLVQRMLDRWARNPPVFDAVDCSSDREPDTTRGSREDDLESDSKTRKTEVL